jgi:hypothetical protein
VENIGILKPRNQAFGQRKKIMKAPIKNFVSGLIVLVFSTGFVWTIGCATRTPDPLAGWKSGPTAYEGNPFNKAITDDYRSYIQKLPSDERHSVSDFGVRFFENSTGQRAVRIEIGVHGTWWEHVLIYDKDNKRIRTIKYTNGGYRS